MAQFRKKPVVIDAIQYTGSNFEEIKAFVGSSSVRRIIGSVIAIPTLEGPMQACVGDWIIRGIKGEFYPCKPDIFEATYDSVLELV